MAVEQAHDALNHGYLAAGRGFCVQLQYRCMGQKPCVEVAGRNAAGNLVIRRVYVVRASLEWPARYNHAGSERPLCPWRWSSCPRPLRTPAITMVGVIGPGSPQLQSGPFDQGNRVLQGWSCILLSFAPCQARRPLSRMSFMPIAVRKHNPPDIPAGLPRSSYQPGPAAQAGMTGNDRKWQENRKISPCKSAMQAPPGPTCSVAETRRDCPGLLTPELANATIAYHSLNISNRRCGVETQAKGDRSADRRTPAP